MSGATDELRLAREIVVSKAVNGVIVSQYEPRSNVPLTSSNMLVFNTRTDFERWFIAFFPANDPIVPNARQDER